MGHTSTRPVDYGLLVPVDDTHTAHMTTPLLRIPGVTMLLCCWCTSTLRVRVPGMAT